MSAQVLSVTGEQLSLREEFTIANWSGNLLDQRFESYSQATEAMETMLDEAEKQGFSPSASRLKVLRREIREIAGSWIG